MEEIIDVDGIISVAVGFSNKIKEVKDAGYNFRKGSKQNFNFFSAIVTSNDEKEHLEKYHSNFIGYLLNPKASHDCESLFLKSFFETIKNEPRHNEQNEQNLNEKASKDFIGFNFNENELSQINLKRELKVQIDESGNFGFIDIVIRGKKNDWLIFIENKVESEERYNQVKGYCAWANGECKDRWLGIYLTKDGNPPGSIHDSEYENKVRCLSYEDIIDWLEECRANKEIINYPHIISAFTQYINIIKKKLDIMEDVEQNKIVEYLEKHPEEAKLLLEFKVELQNSVLEYSLSNKRKITFFEKLAGKLSEILKSELSNIVITSKPEKYREGWKIEFEVNKNRVFLKIEPRSDEKNNNINGSWWGLYSPKCIFWEHLFIGNSDDYDNPEKGMLQILNRKEDDLIKEIAQNIKKKIEENNQNIINAFPMQINP